MRLNSRNFRETRLILFNEKYCWSFQSFVYCFFIEMKIIRWRKRLYVWAKIMWIEIEAFSERKYSARNSAHKLCVFHLFIMENAISNKSCFLLPNSMWRAEAILQIARWIQNGSVIERWRNGGVVDTWNTSHGNHKLTIFIGIFTWNINIGTHSVLAVYENTQKHKLVTNLLINSFNTSSAIPITAQFTASNENNRFFSHSGRQYWQDISKHLVYIDRLLVQMSTTKRLMRAIRSLPWVICILGKWG